MGSRGPRPHATPLLDTNVLVRYYTGEPLDQAERTPGIASFDRRLKATGGVRRIEP